MAHMAGGDSRFCCSAVASRLVALGEGGSARALSAGAASVVAPAARGGSDSTLGSRSFARSGPGHGCYSIRHDLRETRTRRRRAAGTLIRQPPKHSLEAPVQQGQRQRWTVAAAPAGESHPGSSQPLAHLPVASPSPAHNATRTRSHACLRPGPPASPLRRPPSLSTRTTGLYASSDAPRT